MRRKLLGDEHPEVAQSLYDLARVLREAGNLAEAEARQREALALRAKLPAGERAELAESMAELARTLLLEQRFAEAETLAHECLEVREKEQPNDWETFEARTLVGRSVLGQRRPAEAEPLMLAGCMGMKDRAGKVPPWEQWRLRDALQSLIQFYDNTGKADDAAKWRRELAPGTTP